MKNITIQNIAGYVVSVIARKIGGRKYCVCCKNDILTWLPHPRAYSQPPLMKALKVIGSDLINYMCPICHSHDRERHLTLFIQRLPNIIDLTGKSVLHFAPERHVLKYLQYANSSTYICADLYPSNSNIERVDMQEINYPANSFDIVIANHVLEHVVDDRKAIREVSRVLRPGGLAILNIPFSCNNEFTWDDPGINSDYLKTQLCGQSDHVRLYGKDYFVRFAKCGLIPRIIESSSLFDQDEAIKFGFNPAEPLMLYQKAY